MMELYSGHFGSVYHPDSLYQQFIDAYGYQRELSVEPEHYHFKKGVDWKELPILGPLPPDKAYTSSEWRIHFYRHSGVRNFGTFTKEQAMRVKDVALRLAGIETDDIHRYWVHFHEAGLTMDLKYLVANVRRLF
jgi:hypothetical protein